MNWEYQLYRKGKVVKSMSGTEEDPFWSMVATPGVPMSDVAIELSRAIAVDNGEWVKCGCTVTVKCPQTQVYINLAGQLAYAKALEFVNDGMSYLANVPPILMSK